MTNAATFNDKMRAFLSSNGISGSWADYISDFSLLFMILVISILVYYITKLIINRILRRLIKRSTSKWDDHLYEQRVFTRLAMLLPAIILQIALEPSISNYPEAIHHISLFLRLYITVIVILAGISFLNAVYHIYGEFEVAVSKPIKGYIQIGKIILFVVGGIISISILVGQSPFTLLAGLGAMSAVVMLIFKDSILGFVAGVQLSSNKMLQIGDWITLPKFNTDGTVIDISLVTVKVRNFDNSVSFIPAYTLITDSFQNWRSMEEAGGRRLKRSFLVDVRTIRFADDFLRDHLKDIGIPSEVWAKQETPITNLGLFRRYLHYYLSHHPNVNHESTLMIRQLQPAEHGIPLEIYIFYWPADWAQFELFQTELFEHAFAMLSEFQLMAFQRQGSLLEASK